jgi:hypothetical protein
VKVDKPAIGLAQQEAIGGWLGLSRGPSLDAILTAGTWPRRFVCELIAALGEPERSRLGAMPIAVQSAPSLRAFAASYERDGVTALDVNLGLAAGVHGVVRAFAALTVKRSSDDEAVDLASVGEWAGHELKWQASPALRASPVDFPVTDNQASFANDISKGAFLFTLAHELGHISAGDTKTPALDANVVRRREFVADAAALRTLIKRACSPEEDFIALFAGTWAALSWIEFLESFGLPPGAHPSGTARKTRLMRAVRAVLEVPDETLVLARQMEKMFSDLADEVLAQSPRARLPDGRTRSDAATKATQETLTRHNAGNMSLDRALNEVLRLLEADPRPVIEVLHKAYGLNRLVNAIANEVGEEVRDAIIGDPAQPSVIGSPIACVPDSGTKPSRRGHAAD